MKKAETRRAARTVLVLIFLILTPCMVFSKTAEELDFDPLVFKPPVPLVRRLSTGIPVYLLEDHELPLFTLKILITEGSLLEPSDKSGLFSITADSMRTGGTALMSPEEVDYTLESMAATIEIGFDREFGIATLETRAEDIEHGLDLFMEILKNPAFRQDRVELIKMREAENIRRRNENPFNTAWRFFTSRLYGEHHPMGIHPSVDSVTSISRDDLEWAHSLLFNPRNILVTASGDFEEEGLLEILENRFSGWNTNHLPRPPLPELEDISDGITVVYVRKELTQSTILMGSLGLKRTPLHPDAFSLRVMNEILGESSFTSRLYREVREKRGLAYSVGSSFDLTSFIYPGTWFAYAQTRSDSTVATAMLMIDTIRDMGEQPVPETELASVKDSIINSFVFGFDSRATIALRHGLLDFRGYPADYLERYTERISEVTAEEVREAAYRYLDTQNLLVVVVGWDEDFDLPLSEIGNVIEVDPDEAVPSAVLP